MSPKPFTEEIQILLANILKKPVDAPGRYIDELFPELERFDRQDILVGAQRIIQEILSTNTSVGSSTLIQRLRFSWKILRKADKSYIKKIKKEDLETLSLNMDSMKEVFEGILPMEELHSVFVKELCDKLFISENNSAGLLRFCWQALRPKPNKIKLSFINKDGNVRVNSLNGAINWIIRKNRFLYVVEEDERIINIRFSYLSRYVKEELYKYYFSSDLDKIDNLLVLIEDQINNWLNYSCLQGESWDRCKTDDKKEIVTFFQRENELKNEIYIEKTTYSDTENQRISSLEKENTELLNEINQLEKKVAEFTKNIGTSTQPESVNETRAETPLSPSNDLIALLVGIDSKYPFDLLRAIQLGEEQSITIKNFLSHLFYALRKKGFTLYPEQEKFELEYEYSGLYKCVGFEVSPGMKVNVKVEKKGWAIITNKKIVPVSKAIVREI